MIAHCLRKSLCLRVGCSNLLKMVFHCMVHCLTWGGSSLHCLVLSCPKQSECSSNFLVTLKKKLKQQIGDELHEHSENSFAASSSRKTTLGCSSSGYCRWIRWRGDVDLRWSSVTVATSQPANTERERETLFELSALLQCSAVQCSVSPHSPLRPHFAFLIVLQITVLTH